MKTTKFFSPRLAALALVLTTALAALSLAVLPASRAQAAAENPPISAVVSSDLSEAEIAGLLYMLVMTYDVARVVLGGGVTRAGAAFEQPLRHALATLCANSSLAASMLPDEKIIVLPADLNAGVMGAVRLPPL